MAADHIRAAVRRAAGEQARPIRGKLQLAQRSTQDDSRRQALATVQVILDEVLLKTLGSVACEGQHQICITRIGNQSQWIGR